MKDCLHKLWEIPTCMHIVYIVSQRCLYVIQGVDKPQNIG